MFNIETSFDQKTLSTLKSVKIKTTNSLKSVILLFIVIQPDTTFNILTEFCGFADEREINSAALCRLDNST